MAVRFSPDPMSPRLRPLVFAVALATGISACDRNFDATPSERMGYVRELIRARAVTSDTLPIDGCSVDRFMTGIPAWRDSLVDAERRTIVESGPCPGETQPIPGRFVLLRWYRNWSGESVLRGAAYPWDQGYRFTDGIYVGREQLENQQYYAGVAERRVAPDSGRQVGDSLRRDTSKMAGMVVEPLAIDTSRRDSLRPNARP
jgi:hypothetical protein